VTYAVFLGSWLALALSACTGLMSLDDYTFTDTDASAAGDRSVADTNASTDTATAPDTSPSADTSVPDSAISCTGFDFDAGVCFPCPPTQTIEFLNACDDATTCVTFDDKIRVPLYEGGSLPTVPPDASGPDVSDAAGIDVSASEGGD
jgi:hypothetical protein